MQWKQLPQLMGKSLPIFLCWGKKIKTISDRAMLFSVLTLCWMNLSFGNDCTNGNQMSRHYQNFWVYKWDTEKSIA